MVFRYLLFTNFILLVVSCWGQSIDSVVKGGPQIKFEYLSIIDSLDIIEIDSIHENGYWKYKIADYHYRSKPYSFYFTNKGNQPLILDRIITGDPDYCIYQPFKPIMPGERDSILIMWPHDKARGRIKYIVNSNSSTSCTLTIQRLFLEMGSEKRMIDERIFDED